MTIVESGTVTHDYSAEVLWNEMVVLGEPIQVGNLTVMPECVEWEDVLDEYGITSNFVGQDSLQRLEEDISSKKLGTQLSYFIVYQTNETRDMNIVYTDKKIATFCQGLDSRFGFKSIYNRSMPKAFYDLVWNEVCQKINNKS